MLVFNKYNGNIRIGRLKYTKEGAPVYPLYEGFTQIIVLTKSSDYGELSPYLLKDEDGVIMENAWQFRKLYPWVPKSKSLFSRFDNTIIWSHPEETHVSEGLPNEKYWKWREKGFKSEYPIRYPVGNGNHKSKCICILADDGRRLGIEEGRKEVYLKIYSELVKKQPKFADLKKRVMEGENLLIIEPDGPHQESLDYYKTTYGVEDSFIDRDTMLATLKNIKIMLKDPKHSFGHGYCLAMALMEWV
jgi:hypothetical protein